MSRITPETKKSFLNKYGIYLLFALIVLVRIPFLNKGIDYTDTGYNIAKYKYVFYGNGISDIGMFYTDLIGGIIYRLLPAGQLLVYRIMHWIIWLLTALTGYQIFRDYVKPLYYWGFLFALATQIGGEMIYSYYPMSQLLLIVSVLLLHKGLTKEKSSLIMAAGLVSCLNIFFRLTNVFYLSMFLAILWYGYKKKNSRKKICNDAISYILGVILGAIITFGFMLVFMGWNDIVSSFRGYAEVALGLSGSGIVNFLGVEEKSGHSLNAEIKMIGYQGILSIVVFTCFFAAFSLLTFLLERITRMPGDNKKATVIKYAVIAVLAFAASFLFANALVSVNLYILGLAVMTLCIYLLFLMKNDRADISTLCLITLLLSVFSVIGTDKGLQRLFLTRCLQVGILLIMIDEVPLYWEAFIEKLRLKKILSFVNKTAVMTFMRTFTLIMISSVFATGLFSMSFAYCDGRYSEMNASCDDIPLVKGMYTSEIRAAELEEYCIIMSSEELQNKEVAVFGFFPLGLVIGEQQDYFEEVDPCVDYPRFSVEMLLEVIQKKEEAGIAPVIVLSQVDRIQRGRNEGTAITSQAKQAVIDYMLSLHEYKVFSETEFYTVYIPNE